MTSKNIREEIEDLFYKSGAEPGADVLISFFIDEVLKRFSKLIEEAKPEEIDTREWKEGYLWDKGYNKGISDTIAALKKRIGV